jgi:hypothetical protein
MLQAMSRQSRNLALASDAQVSGAQVRACVNRFLLSQVGSQFCAGEAELDVLKQTWRVPILMVTPGFIAGEVGEATVQAYNCQITKHTDAEEMYAAADQLRKRHHAAIKTAFLRTRKG